MKFNLPHFVQDIRIKAIVIGFAVDIGSSTLIGLIRGLAIIGVAVISKDVAPAHLNELRNYLPSQIFGLIGTTVSTGLGGYIAARLGKSHPIAHAFAVGCLSLLFGLTLAFVFPHITPLWKIISGILLTIPAALTGGYLFEKSQQISQS